MSVVVPVYNGEAYLAETLASILSQEPAPGEVVVVNDGSTDSTPDVLASFGAELVVVDQANEGLAAARNAGMARAGGELLGFCDADDLWPVDSLACRLAALEADLSLDMVFGQVAEFVSPEIDDGQARRMRRPFRGTGRLCGAMLARRRAFARAGDFDPDFRVGEFIEWMGRARDLGVREGEVPELALRRRLHGAHLSSTADYRRGLAGVLRARLTHQRATGSISDQE